MGLFDNFKSQRALSRATEEFFYQCAMEEIERGERRTGLWAKALAESDGDQVKARSLYLRLLTTKLKDEAHIAEQEADRHARELAQQEFERRREEQRERELAEVKRRASQQQAKPTVSTEDRFRNTVVGWSVTLILCAIVVVLMISVGYKDRRTFAPPTEPLNQPNLVQPSGGPLLPRHATQEPPSESEQETSTPLPPSSQQPELTEFDRLLLALEKRYPEINPESDLFNQALVDRISSNITIYKNQGQNSVDALLLAVDDVYGDLVAPQQPPMTSEPNFPEPTSPFPNCEYKAVMTNQDYRNCGLELPGN